MTKDEMFIDYLAFQYLLTLGDWDKYSSDQKILIGKFYGLLKTKLNLNEDWDLHREVCAEIKPLEDIRSKDSK